MKSDTQAPLFFVFNFFFNFIFLSLLGVQIMRKFLREKELMITPFPEGMEEFQQL